MLKKLFLWLRDFLKSIYAKIKCIPHYVYVIYNTKMRHVVSKYVLETYVDSEDPDQPVIPSRMIMTFF